MDHADAQTGATIFTCLLAVATAVIGWLSARDKLKFDSERVKLQGRVESLTADVAECKADRDRLRADQDESRELIHLLRSRMEQHGIDCSDHGGGE